VSKHTQPRTYAWDGVHHVEHHADQCLVLDVADVDGDHHSRRAQLQVHLHIKLQQQQKQQQQRQTSMQGVIKAMPGQGAVSTHLLCLWRQRKEETAESRGGGLTTALLPQMRGISMMQVSSAVLYTFMPATRMGWSPSVKYFSAASVSAAAAAVS
jgi:hypothetical protein